MLTQQATILPATIPINTALSDVITTRGGTLIGIQMPAAGWDTAAITLLGSVDNVTFQNVYTTAGAELSITAAAAHYLAVAPTLVAGLPYLQVRSGTGASPVNQTAARTLQLVFRGV